MRDLFFSIFPIKTFETILCLLNTDTDAEFKENVNFIELNLKEKIINEQIHRLLLHNNTTIQKWNVVFSYSCFMPQK